MAIISRISRLFVADVHAVLERLEEPELVLRQSIRDMEEALGAQKRQQQQLAKRSARLLRSNSQLNARIDDLNEQLDASVAAQRMDASKTLVKRKLEAQAQLARCCEQSEQLAQEHALIVEDIGHRSDQLEAMRDKIHVLFEQDELDCETPEYDSAHARVNEQDVEAALLREIERRSAS